MLLGPIWLLDFSINSVSLDLGFKALQAGSAVQDSREYYGAPTMHFTWLDTAYLIRWWLLCERDEISPAGSDLVSIWVSGEEDVQNLLSGPPWTRSPLITANNMSLETVCVNMVGMGPFLLSDFCLFLQVSKTSRSLFCVCMQSPSISCIT